MKALIRNKGETVRETDGIVGIDWTNGEPLTRPEWAGGPYRLVDNYIEPVEDPEESHPTQTTSIEEKPAEQPAGPLPETVSIGGKEYTLNELKKLIE